MAPLVGHDGLWYLAKNWFPIVRIGFIPLEVRVGPFRVVWTLTVSWSETEFLQVEVSLYNTLQNILRKASDKYDEIRQRFFEVYKRGIEGYLLNHQVVYTGNMAAHGGDAITNAIF